MLKFKNYIYVLCTTAILTACVGEDFVEDPAVLKERLSIVSANTGVDTIAVGDTVIYQAKFFNNRGEEELRPLAWSSSKTSVASINNNGRVIGLSEGAANIQVVSGELTDDRLIVVRQVERLEIESNKPSLLVGDSMQLTARYYDKNDVLISTTINWNSSDNSIASINSNGELFAHQKGQVFVLASTTINSRLIESDTLVINVLDDSNAVAKVEISATTNQIMVNETLQFTAVVKNLKDEVIPNPMNLQWSSSDPAVLSIDANGLATANGVGSADIQATVNNVSSNTSNVLVSQAMTSARTGTFSGRNGYRVNGRVTMQAKSGGGLELSFSSTFSTQNGPGLYIYLGNNDRGGIQIQKLSQTSGSFKVDLPSSISIDDYDYVLIWCKPFSAAFGAAKLN